MGMSWCHPGGRYWESNHGVLYQNEVIATHLKIRHPYISSTMPYLPMSCRNLTAWQDLIATLKAIIWHDSNNSWYCDRNMMTSSNGSIFRVTGPLCGEFPSQRPVTRSFDISFDLRLDKWLGKQSWGWWFKTPSRPLWRHCNEQNEHIISVCIFYWFLT